MLSATTEGVPTSMSIIPATILQQVLTFNSVRHEQLCDFLRHNHVPIPWLLSKDPWLGIKWLPSSNLLQNLFQQQIQNFLSNKIHFLGKIIILFLNQKQDNPSHWTFLSTMKDKKSFQDLQKIYPKGKVNLYLHI